MLWYGNGHLWAGVPADGTNRVSVDRVAPDGSIFDKLPWATSPPWEKPAISGERIDVDAPPLDVIRVNGPSAPIHVQVRRQLPDGRLLEADRAFRGRQPHIRRERRRGVRLGDRVVPAPVDDDARDE